MSYPSIKSLEINDKIDFRDKYGRYTKAFIISKTKKLKKLKKKSKKKSKSPTKKESSLYCYEFEIQFENWNKKYNEIIIVNKKNSYRFAKYNTISSKKLLIKPTFCKNLVRYDKVDIKPTHVQK